MIRARELAFRTANAALLSTIGWLHRRFGVNNTYRIGQNLIATEFEGCWFVYSPREFGCTGNVDYRPEAENETRRALFDRIEGSEVFYDIGAHGGVYTITLLNRFPKLVVHSFEPQPEDLLTNLSENSLPIDRVHRVALGEANGSVLMTTKKRSSNHVSSSGNRAVRMVRLDDYASEHDLPFPSWIKIDIEGLELPALKGAERIIREARPRIICEINRLHGRFGTTVHEFLRYMRSHDYEIHRLANGVLTPISGADSFAALGYSADWNFWFLPR